MRRVATIVLFGVISLVPGCETTVTPSVVASGLEEIEPRPEWEAAYDEIALCLDRTGDFSRVRWFTAAEIQNEDGTRSSAGAWLGLQGEPHGIALLKSFLEEVGDTGGELDLVRHEAIHEILQAGNHEGDQWCRCDPHPQAFSQCR